MIFEWDPDKDRANLQARGISFARAAEMDWTGALVTLDDRRDYGEDRFIVLGPIDGRLHVLVYVWRDNAKRIISLRKANARETRRHAEFIKSASRKP